MVRRMRGIWGVLAMVGLASSTNTADAQAQASAEAEVEAEATVEEAPAVEDRLDDAARQLFLAGREAFDAGQYEDALTQFRRAHEISGREQLLYNIGQSLDRLRRDAEAIEAFEAYLATDPPERQRTAIEARLTILRRNVATDPQNVSVDPDPPVEEPRDPGPLEPVGPGEDEDAGAPVGLIVGIVAGVVLVGVAVGVGVALAGRSPDYQAGDSGNVHFALGRW